MQMRRCTAVCPSTGRRGLAEDEGLVLLAAARTHEADERDLVREPASCDDAHGPVIVGLAVALEPYLRPAIREAAYRLVDVVELGIHAIHLNRSLQHQRIARLEYAQRSRR